MALRPILTPNVTSVAVIVLRLRDWIANEWWFEFRIMGANCAVTTTQHPG